MARRVSAAQAKAQLSALSAEVAHGGQRVVIERHGKPMVAMVSMADLEQLGQDPSISERPHGALALAGAWREVDDKDLESMVEEIYGARENDAGRPVDLET